MFIQYQKTLTPSPQHRKEMEIWWLFPVYIIREAANPIYGDKNILPIRAIGSFFEKNFFFKVNALLVRKK